MAVMASRLFAFVHATTYRRPLHIAAIVVYESVGVSPATIGAASSTAPSAVTRRARIAPELERQATMKSRPSDAAARLDTGKASPLISTGAPSAPRSAGIAARTCC